MRRTRMNIARVKPGQRREEPASRAYQAISQVEAILGQIQTAENILAYQTDPEGVKAWTAEIEKLNGQYMQQVEEYKLARKLEIENI